MTYRTTWRTEDGLTHHATVRGNPAVGYEICSDCGLVGNACWEAQLAEEAEITCLRCRSISGAKQRHEQTNPDMLTRMAFGPADVIHVYTRRQAIEDGFLIDVTGTAREAGIRYPTALTKAVWDNFVRVPEGLIGQDEKGRLWDIVWLLRHAARSAAGDTVFFHLYVRNNNHRAKEHLIKAICGPDDDGSPCLTVLLPNED